VRYGASSCRDAANLGQLEVWPKNIRSVDITVAEGHGSCGAGSCGGPTAFHNGSVDDTGKSDLERLGAFLEDIDHTGELTAERANQYLRLLERAGERSKRRYRAAVALTRAQNGIPPGLHDFRRLYGTRRNARVVVLLLEAGFSLPFSAQLLKKVPARGCSADEPHAVLGSGRAGGPRVWRKGRR
jgi:hypothetical protein